MTALSSNGSAPEESASFGIPFLGDVDETILRQHTPPPRHKKTNATPPGTVETLDLTPLSVTTTPTRQDIPLNIPIPTRLFDKVTRQESLSFNATRGSKQSTTRIFNNDKQSPEATKSIHMTSEHGTWVESNTNWRQSDQVLRGMLRQPYEPLDFPRCCTIPRPFVLHTALRAAERKRVASLERVESSSRESDVSVFRARPLPRFYGS